MNVWLACSLSGLWMMPQRVGFSANKLWRGYSHLSFQEDLLQRRAGDGRCLTIINDSTTVSR